MLGARRGPSRGWQELRPLRYREFRLFQELVYKEAGIFLNDSKRALLVGRLSKRLRELGLRSFGDYHEYIASSDREDELATMLDCICTNETHFFREPEHFNYLAQELLPAWRARAALGQRQRRVRAWSAGCSTGEEPVSLAMVLLETLPAQEGWEIEVLATDLSRRALAKGRQGVWSVAKAGEIPEPFLKRYMLRGTRTQVGRMKVGDAIRAVIEWRRLNLNDEVYNGLGSFDIIFCRNVLIYFDTRSRAHVLKRLLQHLGPDGRLFLGHAETLGGVSDQIRSEIPTVYRWQPPQRGQEALG